MKFFHPISELLANLVGLECCLVSEEYIIRGELKIYAERLPASPYMKIANKIFGAEDVKFILSNEKVITILLKDGHIGINNSTIFI